MNYIILTPSGARVKKEIVDNINHTAEMLDILKIGYEWSGAPADLLYRKSFL